MVGEEVSLFALCDGEDAVLLGSGARPQARGRSAIPVRTPAGWALTHPCASSPFPPEAENAVFGTALTSGRAGRDGERRH